MPKRRRAEAEAAKGELAVGDSSFRAQWGSRIDGKRDALQVYAALDACAALAQEQDAPRCANVHFLLDECVSPLLQAVAESFGYVATFIDHRGWRTLKDHQLRPHLLNEDMILVTNNRDDWIALLGAADLHPGLVVIQENVPRAQQIAFFAQCLVAISALPDMVNKAVEVDANGAVIVYALPSDN